MSGVSLCYSTIVYNNKTPLDGQQHHRPIQRGGLTVSSLDGSVVLLSKGAPFQTFHLTDPYAGGIWALDATFTEVGGVLEGDCRGV